jgi:type IV pilus assembly protein PilV
MLNTRSQAGFSMIEILVAILIFAFGVLGMVGLQAASVRYQTDAKYRADASILADEIVARIWVDRPNLGMHLTASTPIASLPNGNLVVQQIDADADPKTNRLRISISWQPPGDDVHAHVLIADVNEN